MFRLREGIRGAICNYQFKQSIQGLSTFSLVPPGQCATTWFLRQVTRYTVCAHTPCTSARTQEHARFAEPQTLLPLRAPRAQRCALHVATAGTQRARTRPAQRHTAPTIAHTHATLPSAPLRVPSSVCAARIALRTAHNDRTHTARAHARAQGHTAPTHATRRTRSHTRRVLPASAAAGGSRSGTKTLRRTLRRQHAPA
jgi:hypothetical protein